MATLDPASTVAAAVTILAALYGITVAPKRWMVFVSILLAFAGAIALGMNLSALR